MLFATTTTRHAVQTSVSNITATSWQIGRTSIWGFTWVSISFLNQSEVSILITKTNFFCLFLFSYTFLGKLVYLRAFHRKIWWVWRIAVRRNSFILNIIIIFSEYTSYCKLNEFPILVSDIMFLNAYKPSKYPSRFGVIPCFLVVMQWYTRHHVWF